MDLQAKTDDDAYTYTDSRGFKLTIELSALLRRAAYVQTQAVGGQVVGVHVPADQLQGIVTALYQAVGQRPPIILPRPTSAHLRAGGRVADGHVIAPRTYRPRYTPQEARQEAAVLGAAADMAEFPDPEAVSRLSALVAHTSSLSRDEAAALARDLLTAGYQLTKRDSHC